MPMVIEGAKFKTEPVSLGKLIENYCLTNEGKRIPVPNVRVFAETSTTYANRPHYIHPATLECRYFSHINTDIDVALGIIVDGNKLSADIYGAFSMCDVTRVSPAIVIDPTNGAILPVLDIWIDAAPVMKDLSKAAMPTTI